MAKLSKEQESALYTMVCDLVKDAAPNPHDLDFDAYPVIGTEVPREVMEAYQAYCNALHKAFTEGKSKLFLEHSEIMEDAPLHAVSEELAACDDIQLITRINLAVINTERFDELFWDWKIPDNIKYHINAINNELEKLLDEELKRREITK